MLNLPQKKRLYWRICCSLAVLVCVVAFTPFVIPRETFLPQLFGWPFSLWMGMLIAVALVTLTLIGARIHPKE
jgi:hypothetical protein